MNLRITQLFVLFTLFAFIGCGGGSRGTNLSGSGTVRLEILDPETGELESAPIPGAVITNVTTGESVVTDENGEFNVPLPDDMTSELRIEVGDQKASFAVDVGSNSLDLEFTVTEEEVLLDVSERVEEEREDGSSNPPAESTPNGGSMASPSPSNVPSGDQQAGGDNDDELSPSPSSAAPSPSSSPIPAEQPPLPVPSPSSSPDPSIDFSVIDSCVARDFFVSGTVIPDLDCRGQCSDIAVAAPDTYAEQYQVGCDRFGAFLSGAFIPRCEGEPCTDLCVETADMFPSNPIGVQLAEIVEGGNCS